MIFFFYGDDTFRSTEKLNQIKEKFTKEVDKQGYNIVSLDGETLTLEKFNETVKQTGFLSIKRLVIIRNIFKNKKLKDFDQDIIEYLKSQKDSKEENYLIFWNEGVPKKTEPLAKTLLGFKYANDFKYLNNTQLLDWVEDKIKKGNGRIEKTAVKTLIAYLGNNLWQINNEIEKLLAYKNNQIITNEDIELMVKAKIDENIFNLTDAVGAKNKKLALKLINDQLATGVNHLYLLTMIVRQFRILLELKSLTQEYESYQRVANHTDLHPFILRKTWPLLALFTIEQLKKIYNKLLILEEKFKSTRIEPVLLFDKFIAEI